MVFPCFLDDSKDKNQSEVFICAGFIGSQTDWGNLRSQWAATLRKHELQYFKSSEYKMLKGEFARFQGSDYPSPSGRNRAKEIRNELLQIARSYPNVMGMGIVIPISIYRNVCQRPEAKLFFEADPYRRALEGVFRETLGQVENLPGHHAVLFVHDEGQDWHHLEDYYHEYKKNNPRHGKMMDGFIPLDDKKHPPLQLADALANQTVSDSKEWLNNGQITLEDEKQFNLCKLGVWNEHVMLSLLKHNLEKRGLPIPADLQSSKYD
jgi:hypothetical protein